MNELGDPAEVEPLEYLDFIEGGETALHVYLKDDKEWWLAHNPEKKYPGVLNGPWLFWSTYPSGPWSLQPETREMMLANVEDLYYIDYEGNEAHSVHELTTKPVSHAPDFVQLEFQWIGCDVGAGTSQPDQDTE